jgi:hypothetical protein
MSDTCSELHLFANVSFMSLLTVLASKPLPKFLSRCCAHVCASISPKLSSTSHTNHLQVFTEVLLIHTEVECNHNILLYSRLYVNVACFRQTIESVSQVSDYLNHHTSFCQRSRQVFATISPHKLLLTMSCYCRLDSKSRLFQSCLICASDFLRRYALADAARHLFVSATSTHGDTKLVIP